MKPLFTLITLQHLQIPTVGGEHKWHFNSTSCIYNPLNYGDYIKKNRNVFFSNVLHSLSRTSAVAVALLDVGFVALVPH